MMVVTCVVFLPLVLFYGLCGDGECYGDGCSGGYGEYGAVWCSCYFLCFFMVVTMVMSMVPQSW